MLKILLRKGTTGDVVPSQHTTEDTSVLVGQNVALAAGCHPLCVVSSKDNARHPSQRQNDPEFSREAGFRPLARQEVDRFYIILQDGELKQLGLLRTSKVAGMTSLRSVWSGMLMSRTFRRLNAPQIGRRFGAPLVDALLHPGACEDLVRRATSCRLVQACREGIILHGLLPRAALFRLAKEGDR